MKRDLRPVVASLSAILLSSCGPSDAEPPAGLPTVQWRIEPIATDALPSEQGGRTLERLFDDGRVVARFTVPGTERPVVRVYEPNSGWRDVAPPETEAGAEITYYEDDLNLGGYNPGPPAHGFVMVDGVKHTYVGAEAVPRAKLADGRILLEGYFNREVYLFAWAPTAAEPDEVDAHLPMFRALLSAVRRISSDGTVYLVPVPNADAIVTTPTIVRDGVELAIGYEQFNRTEPLNLDQESLTPCCRVVNIDHERGGILGIKGGRPVIKRGDTYDPVADEHGDPVIANARGDALYNSLDDRDSGLTARFRWNGTLYRFGHAAWADAGVEGVPTPDGATAMLGSAIDMDAKGRLLLEGIAAGTDRRQLYVATPSAEQVGGPDALASLTFALQSGTAAVPEPMSTSTLPQVGGSFSSSSLNATLTIEGRSLSVNLQSTNNGFALGQPILISTPTPGATVTGSVNYADTNDNRTALATRGQLTVTQPGARVVVTLVDVDLRELRTSSVFRVNGFITLP